MLTRVARLKYERPKSSLIGIKSKGISVITAAWLKNDIYAEALVRE
ncbi:MAG: hypothetical protein ACOX45_03705 [Acutalibacteraceae bacterium]